MGRHSWGDVLGPVEITDTTGDQFMLFDLSQFGTINQLDFEQSAFKASGRLPLRSPLGRI